MARNLLPRFAQAGYSVDAVGIYEPGDKPVRTPWGVVHPVDQADTMGFSVLDRLIETSPEAVVLLHELVHCGIWAGRLRTRGYDGPLLGYFPVYGPGLTPRELTALSLMDIRVAFTTYGKDVVASYKRPCTSRYLGVDHELFHPLPECERRNLRRKLGWDGRFVGIYVARNRWNKQQPKLIHAARVLVDRGFNDFLFYLHCVPHRSSFHWIPGMGMIDQEWDLVGLRRDLGVEDYVQFPLDLSSQTVGIPVRGLVQRMQAADCAVHVAHGEGFGLPLVEALACGLPVLCTKDGRAMEELVGGVGRLIAGEKTITDSSGNCYMDVSPEEWADGLADLRDALTDRTEREELSSRAQTQGSLFRWGETAAGLMASLRPFGEERGPGSWRTG